jgi:hypothetical protein
MRGGIWACAVLATLLLASCRTGRPIPLLHARELPPRSTEKILERVLAHPADTFTHYSARGSVTLKLPDGSRSFKAQIRVVKDSAAWMSVVPALGIEVARVLITTDSLKFMDKLHDQYFVGNNAMVREKFGMSPSLQLLQLALAGAPIGLDPEERYRSEREDGHYVLTSREKRRFVRAAEDISPGDTLARDRDMGERRLERTLRKAEEREAVVYRYWIEPDNFRVTRVQIIDLARDQTADVRYEERGGEELSYLPTRMRITLSEPGRQASGSVELSRINLEGPLQMSFTIPEKYEPMP